jgi:hypothetical protein
LAILQRGIRQVFQQSRGVTLDLSVIGRSGLPRRGPYGATKERQVVLIPARLQFS